MQRERTGTALLRSAAQAGSMVWSAHRKLVVALVALSVAGAALAAAELLLLRNVVSSIDASNDATVPLVLFAAAAALRRTARSANQELTWLAAQHVDRQATEAVLDVATAASFESFENPDFRDRLARAMGAARNQSFAIVWSLVSLSTSVLTTITLVVIIVGIVPSVIVPLALAGGLLLAIATVTSRLRYALVVSDTPDERERNYLRLALTSTSEGKEIRLFGSRPLLLGRFSRLFEQRIVDATAVARKRMLAELAGNAALSIAILGALVLVADRASDGTIGLADAAAAAFAVQQLATNLQTIAATSSRVMESARAVNDLRWFMSGEHDQPATATIGPDFDEFKLDGVGFTYPGATAPSLIDIDLTIRPGEVIALVGANGSGKSTLINVLCGLYRPTVGSVTVTNRGEITEVRQPLTGMVGAVFQDHAKYELSVTDNVSLGDPLGRSNDDLRRALDGAGMTDLVDAMPDGLATRLGRQFAGGRNLSIGQWQRLAFARAIQSPTSIVLLDEPSSAADVHAEQAVFRDVRRQLPGRAVIIASHRFATVTTADRIIVMDEGRIVEQGLHAELLALGGVYASMYRVQAPVLEPVIDLRHDVAPPLPATM